MSVLHRGFENHRVREFGIPFLLVALQFLLYAGEVAFRETEFFGLVFEISRDNEVDVWVFVEVDPAPGDCPVSPESEVVFGQVGEDLRGGLFPVVRGEGKDLVIQHDAVFSRRATSRVADERSG